MVNSDLAPVHAALATARQRLVEMEAAGEDSPIVEAWTSWVVDVNRVWSRLAGAMTGGKYVGIHGRLKKERKDDPLLQYVHQSRHSVEHRGEPLAKVMFECTPIGPPIEASGISFTVTDNLGVQHVHSGPMQQMRAGPTRAELAPVTNEGRVYPPPTEHLGKNIANPTPLSCATLVMDYLDRTLEKIGTSLIADARQRAGLPPL
jgi:hypothetical protein